MTYAFHKCVLNAMTAPNPPKYTKFDTYQKKRNRAWSEIGPKSDFVFAISASLQKSIELISTPVSTPLELRAPLCVISSR